MGWDAQRRYLRQLSDERPFLQRRDQAVWRGRVDGGARDQWRCGTRSCVGPDSQLAVLNLDVVRVSCDNQRWQDVHQTMRHIALRCIAAHCSAKGAVHSLTV